MRHANYCSCRTRSSRSSSVGSGLIGYDLAAIAAALLIIGIIWVVQAPLRIWHVTGTDGQEHPDTATWIAYGTSAAVIVGAMVFFSCRSAAKRNAAARRHASVAGALRAADEDNRGGPRDDLRRVTQNWTEAS